MRRWRFYSLLSLGSFLLLASSAAASADAPSLRLKRGSFDPLLGVPELPPHLKLAQEPDGGYFVVQFKRSIDPRLIDRLRSVGAVPIQYLPERGYLVRLPAAGKARLREWSDVRWFGAVQPGWKLSPDLDSRPASTRLRATVDLFPGEPSEPATAALAGLGIEVLQTVRFGTTRRIHVDTPRETLERAASLESVAWIEPLGQILPRNNTVRWVVQSDVLDLESIWDHGLHGEGQIIGHIDSPIYMDSCYFKDPVDNTPGPGHRKVVAYRSSSGLGQHPHGTHTAGTAVGDQFPIHGTLDQNGLAYAARISFGNLDDITGSGSQTSNLYTYLADAYSDGARVHTNSWGDDTTSAYTTWSRDIDSFTYDFEDSLVVFAVSNGPFLRTPENAKNVLAVVATLSGTAGDNWCAGGAGPTSDGRRKPEIAAPGCSVFSASTEAKCAVVPDAGTSMATPAIAAAGALARQYFEEGWYPGGSPNPSDAYNPSGALVRAVLLNAAVDMAGLAGFPGNVEGWGRLVLENGLYFDGDARNLALLADQRNADGLTTGENDSFIIGVTQNTEDLEVTLVFTEPPAALMAAAATINNLDLELVSPSGLVYTGNGFDTFQGASVVGAPSDPVNNVEMARIPSPELGDWRVRVKAAAVNQGAQGYALIGTGQIDAAHGGSVRYTSHSVLDGLPLGNGDGFIDPGETVTLPVSVFNRSPTAASGLTGRLETPLPEAVQLTGPQASYADLARDATGGSFAPHFQFTVAPDVSCGAVLTFELEAAHANGSSLSLFSIPIGSSPGAAVAGTAPSRDARDGSIRHLATAGGGGDAQLGGDCSPLDCGGDPVPGEVGTTMTVAIENDADLRFSFPAVAGASAYRIWRSATPDFARQEFVGVTSSTSFLEIGGLNAPSSWYYRVRAVNACNWQGP